MRITPLKLCTVFSTTLQTGTRGESCNPTTWRSGLEDGLRVSDHHTDVLNGRSLVLYSTLLKGNGNSFPRKRKEQGTRSTQHRTSQVVKHESYLVTYYMLYQSANNWPSHLPLKPILGSPLPCQAVSLNGLHWRAETLIGWLSRPEVGDYRRRNQTGSGCRVECAQSTTWTIFCPTIEHSTISIRLF